MFGLFSALALCAVMGIGWRITRGRRPLSPAHVIPLRTTVVVDPNAAARLQLLHLYNLGMDAWRANDLTQAAAALALAAERGHARAQLHFGMLCEHGFGVPLDWTRAMHWYECAERGGDEDAKFRIELLRSQHHKPAALAA